jgi:RimJ/RimL family protein N-acetyltransferase
MSPKSRPDFPPRIETRRLTLAAATASLVRAEMEDLPRFFRLLGVRPSPLWPPEDVRDALPFFREELESRPHLAGWLSWYWVLRGDSAASSRDERGRTADGDGGSGILVGTGGFKGPPIDGTVEIGYCVLAPYRRRGYATEAVEALLGWAFAHAKVRLVVAETAADNVPSLALLAKLGFEPSVRVGWEDVLRLVLRGGAEGAIRRDTSRWG